MTVLRIVVAALLVWPLCGCTEPLTRTADASLPYETAAHVTHVPRRVLDQAQPLPQSAQMGQGQPDWAAAHAAGRSTTSWPPAESLGRE